MTTPARVTRALLRLVVLVSVICFSTSLFAQLIDYGQNPPGLHWKSLKSKHIELIFPESYSIHARRMAAILEKTTRFENRSLNVVTRPLPVLLQNQGVESNAFVLLAPRRSEFYTLSPADQEPGDWLESLGLHEMRHVVQEDKVFNGHKIPLGESFQLAVFGLVFPPWFFEGDAVVMETALTASGRGRLPRFKREYRVNLLNGKEYSYSKYYLGSQRDNIPDYYRLGYFMVSKMRRDYSDSTYDRIFEHALKPRPWPLSTSLRQTTGMRTSKFFTKTMNELKTNWMLSYQKVTHEKFSLLNKRKDSVYSNYLLPHTAGNDTILYLGTSLNHIPGLYLKPGRTLPEELLTRIGSQLIPHFDYAAGRLVWDEERSDPRYAYRTYSVLRTMDIHTGLIRTLTHKSRLFVPSLSYDGKLITAIHSDLQNRVEIQILDAVSGQLLRSFKAGTGQVYQFPKFNSAGTHIICIRNSNSGKSLYEFNLETGLGSMLTRPVFNDISRPSYLDDDKICFTFSGSLTEDIYFYDRKSGSLGPLTHSRFGASAALGTKQRILFNDFGLRGDDIAEKFLKNQAFENDPSGTSAFFNRPKNENDTLETRGSAFIEQRTPVQRGSEPPDSSYFIAPSDSLGTGYPIKPYHETSNLFHVHSILPLLKQVDLGSLTYLAGVELLSTNLLNTMEGYSGAYYDNNQGSMQYEAGFTYKKWYPYISVYLTDKRRYSLAQGKLSGKTIYLPFHYREIQYNLSVEVPLNFTIGDQVYQTGVQVLTSLTHNGDPSIPLRVFRKDISFPLHYAFYLLKSRLQSTRDLYPAWSQNLSISYESLPFETKLTGRTAFLNSKFYFPGFAPHHSLQLSLNMQSNRGEYATQRNITEVSGYEALPPNILKNTLLAAYYFPIAYTDWQISSLVYIHRVQAGIFGNGQNITSGNGGLYGRYLTYGPDIRVDCNLLRYYLPVFQLGTRVVFFQHNIASPRLEFLLNYSL